MADAGLPGSAAFGVATPGVLTMPGAPATTGVLAPPETQDGEEAAAADAARAIEPVHARYPEVKVEITASVGDPVLALTGAGAEARLIVVGAHRRRGLFAVGAGHVVEGLLSHSPVPVAVIPAHSADADDDG
jgi:nucleotide-binding universal stress UspA family protein